MTNHKEKLIELVKAGHIDQARELCEALGVPLNLRKSCLARAKLSGSDLRGADLRGASLYIANLSLARLTQANLRGADLRGILYDSTTIWPEGFTPPPSR